MKRNHLPQAHLFLVTGGLSAMLYRSFLAALEYVAGALPRSLGNIIYAAWQDRNYSFPEYKNRPSSSLRDSIALDFDSTPRLARRIDFRGGGDGRRTLGWGNRYLGS